MIRIVIVDDESITRQWVKKKIEDISSEYCIIGVFSNGRQALEFCKNQIVDVIFTDIRMSTMDGMEFLTKLQELNQHPYKVILSAYDDFQYAREAIKLGVHEFLLKPEITQDELRRILKDAQNYLIKNGEATVKDDNSAKRQEILGNVMENASTMTEQEITDIFYENDIKLQEKNLTVMCIQSEEKKGMEKTNDILEIFFEEKHLKWYCFNKKQQEIAILYNQPESYTRRKLSEELCHIIETNTGIKLYVGVSTRTDDWTKIGIIWHHAVTAKENRYFFKQQNCILYDEMTVSRQSGTGEELIFDEEYKEILKLLDMKKFDAVREKSDELLEKIGKSDFLPPTYIKAICNEILTSLMCRIHVEELDKEQEKSVRKIQLLLGENIHTFGELSDKMKNAQEYLCVLLEKKYMQSRYSDSIKKVIEYVNMHYQERIVMEDVAEAVHLSRAYLSLLFKKETGEKFSDYLQKIRLKKACLFLKNTGLQINEIAEQTGFFDAAHFSRVFKEHYSISPAEYRKQDKI